MVWLIVLVVMGLAVVLLLASVLALLRGLRGLGEAMHRLHARAAQAQRLTPALARMQGRAEEVQRTIAGLQERTAPRRAAGASWLAGGGAALADRAAAGQARALAPVEVGRHRRSTAG